MPEVRVYVDLAIGLLFLCCPMPVRPAAWVRTFAGANRCVKAEVVVDPPNGGRIHELLDAEKHCNGFERC